MRPTIDALAAALYDYLGRAEPVVHKTRTSEYRHACTEEDVEIVHFRQSWPNTACMFTGRNTIAGQAFTSAWTTVIWRGDEYEVYCNGRRAYGVSRPNDAFLQDLVSRNMADQRSGSVRYHDEDAPTKPAD